MTTRLFRLLPLAVTVGLIGCGQQPAAHPPESPGEPVAVLPALPTDTEPPDPKTPDVPPKPKPTDTR